MPVISNVVYTVTDSTIVATWTTDVSSDSNLTASGKAAIDNGIAANSTSHQCIVAGLAPNTVYSCVVTSGGTSSSLQNVKTNPSQNRIPVLSASHGSSATCAFAATGGGDSLYTFVSSDNISYCTMNDGYGFSGGANNAGANFQIGKITNESTFAGADVNLMTSYLGFATQNGNDGPGGIPLRGGSYGPFGLNGNLFLSLGRSDNNGTFLGMGNVIRDNGDHGATWNRYDLPTSFAANGQGPATGIYEYAQNTYDDGHFVRYAADDGTLGYNTAGNQIDGANAYVYITFKVNATSATTFLMRWPRISFNGMDNTKIQYWIGPASPTPANFVDDNNWSASDASKTSILTTAFNTYDPIVSFIAGINRYILTYFTGVAHGTAVWHFYEAPTPAGPWTEFFTLNTSPNGWIAPMPFHRDCFSNVLTDNIPIRLLYAGDFNVPALYKAHFSTLTLRTTVSPANSFIQGTGTTTGLTSATPSLAFLSNVSTGNLLISAFRDGGPAHAVNSVTDNMGVGNVWTVVYDTEMSAPLHVNGAWAYCFSKGSGPCTVTWNLASSTAGCVISLAEWHGPNTARGTPAMALFTTQTTLISNQVTASAGDLLVGIFTMVNGSTTAPTPLNSFNLRASSTASGSTYAAITDFLNASAGGQNAQATITGTQAGNGAGLGVFYTQPFSISGNAGIPGATVSYSGPTSGTVTADASGNFTIPNLFNGSYTITPSLPGYIFNPGASNQTMAGANITGVNFVATHSSSGFAYRLNYGF